MDVLYTLFFPLHKIAFWAFQVALVVKNLTANAGDLIDMGSVPGSGRSRGEGNGNPLQCSCLGNPMDRGAWRATVLGVAESDMTVTNTFTFFKIYL